MHGNALETRFRGCFEDVFGRHRRTYECGQRLIFLLGIGQVEKPARDTVGSRVRAGGKGSPVCRRPHRHGGIRLAYNAGISQLLEIRQDSLGGKPLVHGKHHAVESDDVDALGLVCHSSHSLWRWSVLSFKLALG